VNFGEKPLRTMIEKEKYGEKKAKAHANKQKTAYCTNALG